MLLHSTLWPRGSRWLLTSKSQKQKIDFSWDKVHLLNCFFGQPAEAKGDLDSRENGPLSSLHLFLLILKDGGLDCPLSCERWWLRFRRAWKCVLGSGLMDVYSKSGKTGEREREIMGKTRDWDLIPLTFIFCVTLSKPFLPTIARQGIWAS